MRFVPCDDWFIAGCPDPGASPAPCVFILGGQGHPDRVFLRTAVYKGEKLIRWYWLEQVQD